MGGRGRGRGGRLPGVARCTVERLYVAPEHQGRGVGSLLLSQAKALSPDGLRLCTFQRCAQACAFYEARGFVPIALTDGATNPDREPDVLYEWRGEA